MSPESLTFSISQSTLLDGNRDSMEKEKIETTVQTKPILFPLNLGFEHILLLLPLCLQILYFQNSLGVSGRLFYSLQYCNIGWHTKKVLSQSSKLESTDFNKYFTSQPSLPALPSPCKSVEMSRLRNQFLSPSTFMFAWRRLYFKRVKTFFFCIKLKY